MAGTVMQLTEKERKEFIKEEYNAHVQKYERWHKEGVITAEQRDALIRGANDFNTRMYETEADLFIDSDEARGEHIFAGAYGFKVPDDPSGGKEINKIFLLTVGPDEKGEYKTNTLEMTEGEAYSLGRCLESVVSPSYRREHQPTSKPPTPKRGRRKR